MSRSNPSSWLARLRLVILAAAPALACVSGAAEPFEGALGPATSAGSTSFSGSTTSQAGSPSVAGSPSSGGSVPGVGGSPGASGGPSPSGGMPGSAGTPVSMGGAPPEICNFPAWMPGKDYAAGDKVMHLGKAYVATEANPGYDPVVSTFFWSVYSCEPGGNGGSGGGPVINDGDCVLEKLLPEGETTYHAMFIPPWQGHQEKPLYSYAALCTALKGFGQFANSGNAEVDKREIAAFFAHVAKESAFLEQTDEAGQPSNSQDYHGRGAIQLTGQSNYQKAGDYLQKNLVGTPGMVSTDPVTNWQAALWFWVIHNNPGTAGTQNCHQAMQAGDFAQTTRIINGGIECPGSASAVTRADYYKNNCTKLGVSPGSSLVC